MSNETINKLFAVSCGALGANFDRFMNFRLQTPIRYTYEINWAETFQVCWKAAIGALVGLLVKSLYEKITKPKSKKNETDSN